MPAETVPQQNAVIMLLVRHMMTSGLVRFVQLKVAIKELWQNRFKFADFCSELVFPSRGQLSTASQN